MSIFPTRARVLPPGRTTRRQPRSETRRDQPVPPRFRAVAEAWESGSGAVVACAVLGQQLAQDGASLAECLEGLRVAAFAVTGGPPGFEDTQALSVAWSETTLGYLNEASCHEPLTGLATLAHVRSRLGELHRDADRRTDGAGVRDTHALVLIEPYQPATAVQRAAGTDIWVQAMRMVTLARAARTVFSGSETIGRLGMRRIVVLATRDRLLARRVALLRRLIAPDEPSGTRVWIEGLPSTEDGGVYLLDELSRG